MPPLGPDKARIFRITHVQNVPFILDNGIHCRSGDIHDPAFIPIGLPELIEKRAPHPIPIEPGGTLSDYIPFYFTPFSIMMYNIKTGHGGVIQRENDEIAILVSSLHRVAELGLRFVFTDSHAYMNEATAYNDLQDLDKIDWPLLNSRNFRKDPEDPGKQGRYQAEALIHRHVPVEALLGIVCYNQARRDAIKAEVERRDLEIPVKVLPKWYF